MTDPVEWGSEVIEPLVVSAKLTVSQVRNGFVVATNIFSEEAAVYCTSMPQVFTLLTAWRERRRAMAAEAAWRAQQQASATGSGR